MARRKRHEEPESHERWLISYADFITLLFAFFVVMYSISSINEGKYRVLSESLESVFSQPSRTAEPIQVGEISRGEGELSSSPGKPILPVYEIELPDLPRHQPPGDLFSLDILTSQLTSALSNQIDLEHIIIRQFGDRIEIEMRSNFLFASGDARISRSAVPVISEIADILTPIANTLQIEGFTDNLPINTTRYPSNWELSAARAASVVNLLNRFGVSPERMSAIGHGEYKPVTSNATEEGRQKNRRVVVVVSDSHAKPLSEHLNTLNTDPNNQDPGVFTID